jgi:hypothetical protein
MFLVKNKGYILFWMIIWQTLIMGIVLLCFEEVIEQQRMNRLFQRHLGDNTLLVASEVVDKHALM